MSIKVQSFGGPIVWLMRKKFSRITSMIMLSCVDFFRRKKISKYISHFLKASPPPDFKFLMIETVNRCNGTCSFCPANTKYENRPYSRMTEELIDKIISDLKKQSWKGTIFPQVNNEPLIDNRMLDFIKLFKTELPECKINIITNGRLLTEEIIDIIAYYADEIIINDYSNSYFLSDKCRTIYKYVRRNKNKFQNTKIIINRRYNEEVLATRAGNAPNKNIKNNHITSPCIYMFTDLIIFPNGNVGMCCNDCQEITLMGNVAGENLFDIWKSEKFVKLRNSMALGRVNIPFCTECDVVDAGSREKEINVYE